MRTTALLSPLRLDDRAIVGRLRLHADERADRSAARARVERLLSGDALDVPGLTSSHVLCVRTLNDPRPDEARLDPRDGPSTGWERAVRAELEQLVRRAARPLDGTIPAGAPAVIFRDRAEVLACMARDWTRGAVAACWWWRYLIRSSATTDRVAPALWLADPRHVPAAARLLASRNLLVPFAAALADEESRGLVARVGECFGIDWAAVPATRLNEGPEGVRDVPTQRPATSVGGDERWVRWAPEAEHAAIPEPARAFVVTSLLLARAPSVARDARVLATIRGWTETAAAGSSRGTEPLDQASPSAAIDAGTARSQTTTVARSVARHDAVPPRTQGGQRSADATPAAREEGNAAVPDERQPAAQVRAEHLDLTATREVAASTTELHAEAESTRPAAVSHDATPPRHPPDELEEEEKSESGRTSSQDGDPPIRVATPPSERTPLGPARAAEVAPFGVTGPRPAPAAPAPAFPTPRPLSAPAPTPANATHLGTTITTRYGGVFFLVNALLALELYGDFTRPRTRMVSVSPWRLLARLARRLAGAAVDDGDSLWALLEDLAGPDAASEEWPGAWRVKTEWLRPFPERDGWTYHVARGRLRVEHPAGFAVIDVPAEGDVPTQLTSELEGYGALLPVRVPGTDHEEIWPDALARFLRQRIHTALRAADPDASVRLLTCLAARVVATETSVDVTMALAELPIAIRYAGLDRDPGWVPAAGRSLVFYFH
ncbi:MAG TPA: hypothetical protein VKU41_13050 [Polyangiaceae bacterium]|nr:hypothetical protein [Polyangiaceae bacterium]